MKTVEETFSITGQEARPMIRSPSPSPKAQEILDADARYIATTTKTAPIVARSAKGAVVLTEEENVLLDFTSGVGVVNTGHCHPAVVKAIQEQAAQLVHFAGTDFYYAVQSDLARELITIVPGSFAKKAFFANSGTEANEAAIKLVRWSTRRPLFLAFARGFHGRTQGSLSLSSSKAVHKERFFPTMPGAFSVPFPDPYRNPFKIDGYADPDELVNRTIGFVEEVLDAQAPASEVGAFFAEPILGEGGYVFPPQRFFGELKRLLDGHGILLVADEVQTGFGRTGKMFAMEHFGVAPQVTTLAKALGSGLPIGACVFDAKLDWGVSGAHSNTFGGNPVTCAAARATIRVMREERLPERAARLGPILGEMLRELQKTYPRIGDVRGLGLMWALDFVSDRATKKPDKEYRDRVLRECHKRGLMLLPCGKSAIRVIPPLVVSEDQLRGGVSVIAESLKTVGK